MLVHTPSTWHIFGSDGNNLVHPTTFEHCRSLYRPNLFTRDDYQSWWESGAKNVSEVAAEILLERLDEYTKPPIDEGLEQALVEFVTRRKKLFFDRIAKSRLRN